ncbi:polysaccharide pyruvyl transferase family protein [Kineococcus sp. SYSU DK001]|uniref:polysaccharide pyruvyl transferase family protein n=1 Tax=Kineococcus sp. SYSU DK001 TaxID=3383122 RepID=UPI003D7DCF89
MTIDIRGVHSANLGAQLMLQAITQRLGGTFALSSNPTQGSYEFRARLGLGQTLHDFRRPRLSIAVGNRLPAGLAGRYGLVRDRDITGVLDASGFAYSDSFAVARHQREADFGANWHKHGVPRVMLPQAFGPFTDQEKAGLTRQILTQSALVFVRDDVSLGYVRSLGISTPVERAVDFTIGLTPPPFEPVATGDVLALVPNGKLISSGVITREAYVDVFTRYAAAGAARGLTPLVVVHEANDLDLGRAIAAAAGSDVFTHEDALVLKAVLGQAAVVVASRFHAVVGALSQGVPTLALGWSHKYAELMREFGVAGWNVTAEQDPAERLTAVTEDGDAKRLLDTIPVLKESVERMWLRTIDVLKGGR